MKVTKQMRDDLAAAAAPYQLSRIERAAEELKSIRSAIADLEAKKDELAARILLMLRNEGEVGADGKLRLDTPLTSFVLVQQTRQSCDLKKLDVALLGIGVTPEKIATVKSICVKTTESEWAGVYPKPQAVPSKAS